MITSTLSHTIQSALRDGTEQLMAVTDTPQLEAQLLLGHILDASRTWLLTWSDKPLETADFTAYQAAIARRATGEPLPYILGSWEFFGVDFIVSEHTLIPRPETELLVEAALDYTTAQDRQLTLVDIGTGTGCIGLSIAANTKNTRVTLVDICPNALEVAEQNARNQNVFVTLRQADLLDGLGMFDVICSNPPYVAPAEMADLAVSKFEPHLALDGGSNRGLDVIERLLDQAVAHLNPSGLLLVEFGSSQGAAIRDLAVAAFPNATVEIIQDYAGLDRLLRVTLP